VGRRAPLTELHAAAMLALGALCFDVAGGSGTPAWLAPGSAVAACALLCWGTWRRDELVWRGPALLGLLAPITGTLAALGSLLSSGRAASHSAGAAGAICFASALSLALVARQWRARAPLRAQLELALGAAVRRPAGSAEGELRPGEEFLLEPGERSPADAVIVAGRGRVEPWFASASSVPRQEGDTLLAGARVVEGALRAVVRWAGMDRAWARLTFDPERRADRHAVPARLVERLCTSGALALAVLGALLAFSTQPQAALVLSSAAALAATLCSIALPEIVALQISGGVSELLARGVSFREPGALDRAARVGAVVFCAEGTLFCDEPSVASIEPAGNLSKDELLALIAGAFAGVASPLASALQRCIQDYQVRPDGTRSPNHTPGLGVTAVASTGQSLVVGTRALLLGRHISVAGAESRIAELEALGRSVLLAALDGRYVGLLALQDGIASGARAAVQHLLDAQVEAVLLSGEARETSKALAHHLGIDHVRAEVAPEARAAELRRLEESLTALAVVGRASKDDSALGAASLSINIDGAGGPLERWDVDVASGSVRDAAWAVHVARKLYADTTRSILTAAAPALVALLTSLIGMPAWLAPIAGVMGSALALHRLEQQRRWLLERLQGTELQSELPPADLVRGERPKSDGPGAQDCGQRAPAASS
jgi:cation transport ATPase